MKKFLITVDTEGDNLWDWKLGDLLTTENARFLPRFQSLCENYGFIPVYLTNYEMVQSDFFCQFFRKKALEGKCEIGMHLHAWNTPPLYQLKRKFNGLPYITEYPVDIIYEKNHFLKRQIESAFELSPTSYRSGRWATNDKLFSVLAELGFTVDCSVTPDVSWSHCEGMTVSGGNNYNQFPHNPYRINPSMIEVPLTSRRFRCLYGQTWKRYIKNILFGVTGLLRPATASLELMKRITMQAEKNEMAYLEFMVHSSELMAGGSPYFRTAEDIEVMYRDMEEFFKWISGKYEGISLKNYGKLLIQKGI